MRLSWIILLGFMLSTTSVNAFSLKQLPSQPYFNPETYLGRWVVLNFWASWCPPCQAEWPNLRVAHNQFKEAGVVFVAISLDANQSAYEKFLRQYGAPFVVGRADARLIQFLKERSIARAIPVTYIFDKQGNLFYHHSGYISLYELQEQLKIALKDD